MKISPFKWKLILLSCAMIAALGGNLAYYRHGLAIGIELEQKALIGDKFLVVKNELEAFSKPAIKPIGPFPCSQAFGKLAVKTNPMKRKT